MTKLLTILPFIILSIGGLWVLSSQNPHDNSALEDNRIEILNDSLQSERKLVRLRIDSMTTFINHQCLKKRLNCTIQIIENTARISMPIENVDKFKNNFICGYKPDILEEYLRRDHSSIILEFPIEGDYIVLPTVLPACLASTLEE